MFNISIGNNTKKYMSVLKIESFPFSEQTLKTNFRELAMQSHPDTNQGDSNANEKFRIIKEAYDNLLNLATSVSQEDIDQELHKQNAAKEDIFALYDRCFRCKGSGKVLEMVSVKSKNPFRCMSGRNFKCHKCDNGIFTLRNGRKVPCLACKGKGFFHDKHCFWCSGSGIYDYESKSVRVDCSDCRGTGRVEIKPFNPVIPKGGVMI